MLHPPAIPPKTNGAVREFRVARGELGDPGRQRRSVGAASCTSLADFNWGCRQCFVRPAATTDVAGAERQELIAPKCGPIR
jgi:hypothetical protein